MGIPHIQAFVIPHDDWQTDADNFDLLNGVNNVANVTNSMPWAGTIGRVLIGHTDTIGNGNLGITLRPDGTSTGEINHPNIPFTSGAGAGIVIVDVNQAFDKDDGIVLRLNANTLQNRGTRVTVEVTFSFV